MRGLLTLFAVASLGASEPAIALAQDAPQAAPATSSSPGAVFVHIDSPRPVNLQLKGNDRRHSFHSICTSPCDIFVPADGEYRIGGDGAIGDESEEALRSFDVQPSRRFLLHTGPAGDTITVEPSSQFAFATGIVISAVGGVALALAGMWALANGFSSFDGGTPNQTGPLVTAVAGGTAIVGGVFLIAFNARTQVSQTSARTLELPPMGERSNREVVPNPKIAISPSVPTLFRLTF